MTRIARIAVGALAALAILLVAGGALAQRGERPLEAVPSFLEKWEREANAISEQIEAGGPEFDEISAIRADLQDDRARMSTLATQVQSELDPLLAQREALGPPPEEGATESEEVAQSRKRLNAQIEEIEGLKRRLSQADARAASMIDGLLAQRREMFTKQLLSRGPSPLEPGVMGKGLASGGKLVTDLVRETSEIATRESLTIGTMMRLVGVVGLIALVGFFQVRFRRLALERVGRLADVGASRARLGMLAAMLTAVRLVGPFLGLVIVLTVLFEVGYLGEQGQRVAIAIGSALAIVIAARAFSGAFFSPHLPRLRLSSMSDADAYRVHRWVVLLAGIVGLDRMMIVHGEEIGLAVEGLSFFNAAIMTGGAFALWQIARQLRRGERPSRTEERAEEDEESDDPLAEVQPGDAGVGAALMSFARFALGAVAVVAPLLAFLGYYAASRYLFYPAVFSAALIASFVFLSAIVRELVEGLLATDETREAPSGRGKVRLIPVLVGTILVFIALPLLALIWGASRADIVAIWRSVSTGFTVGEVTISPLEFFSFAAVFAIGFSITRLIQRMLRRSVLPLTGLDAGGRAAVTAGVGYLGVTVSALLAVSTAGLDLSNLAIVAGALSVGIGFGLQNIVNNFVSGLILLIERPIKAGDWISITSGMGYVKQINVRSTEIETFDRSSLIVPNSELISSTVTNYTHGSLQGRLIVRVGVAYGTDTRKVEQILLDIARAHPMVLRRPAPWINFAGFGDSALNFEIRAILRDVNWVINVGSDLNHEIARRFAEEGIEIPFPQRDLHIRSGPVMRGLGEGKFGVHHASEAIASLRAADKGKGATGTAAPSGGRGRPKRSTPSDVARPDDPDTPSPDADGGGDGGGAR